MYASKLWKLDQVERRRKRQAYKREEEVEKKIYLFTSFFNFFFVKYKLVIH